MTFGSLFAGIGGFDLGLERAGMTCKWQVEVNPFCRKVLKKHWPNVPRFKDVRNVGGQRLYPVDLVCGGFPCQDISNAGKGVGIVGSRSGLWSEFARIIGEIRPRWVVAENVSALRGKGLVLVLQNLDALGYDAEWHCIPASAVGAPHQRDRIWIIAYTDRPGSSAGEAGGGGGSPVQNWQRNNPQSSTGRANVEPRVARERSVAYPDDDGSHRTRIPEVERKGVSLAAGRGWPSGGEALSVSDQWASEPDVGRVADGVPYRVDRLMSLGNAIVPEIMYQIGTRIREIHERS